MLPCYHIIWYDMRGVVASSWVTTVMVMGGGRTEEDRQCPRQIVWFAGSIIVTTVNNFLFLDAFGHIRWDLRPNN